MRRVYLLILVIVSIGWTNQMVKGQNPPSNYEGLIEQGDNALRAFDTKGAREYYSAAIKLDPTAVLGYFKRAEVWTNIEKHSKAAEDYTQILTLKPQDVKARVKRAQSYLSSGQLSLASEDVNALLKQDRGDIKANSLKKTLGQATKLLESIQQQQAHLGSLPAAQQTPELISQIQKDIEKLLVTCPNFRDILFYRGQLGLQQENNQLALDVTAKLLKMNSDDVDAYCLRGEAFLHNGDTSMANRHFKEGLKLDPEHKKCRVTWKQTKSLSNQLSRLEEEIGGSRWAQALELITPDLITLVDDLPIFKIMVKEKQCQCYSKLKKITDGLSVCNEAIQLKGDSISALLSRAELRLLQEDWGAAIADFNRVLQIDGNHAEASEGVNRAKKLEKQAKAKDYYKILGVSRDATTKEIKRAYFDLVPIWHPDKVPEERKEEANLKFREIKEAYEVLSNPDQRAIFDRGEDPLDPHRQSGHPGAQGGHPFGFQFNGFPGFTGFNGFPNFQFRQQR